VRGVGGTAVGRSDIKLKSDLADELAKYKLYSGSKGDTGSRRWRHSSFGGSIKAGKLFLLIPYNSL